MNGFPDVQNLFSFSISAGQVIRNLIVALSCGVLISRFYCWTTKRPSNSRAFIGSLITLAMITAVVIMVIGNNLARAFGLVGAMSIIRFRTAVKDVQDIVFIFFSLTIGMAAGIGQSMIAFIGTIGIGLVMLAFVQAQSHTHRKREYLLQFSFASSSEGEAPYLSTFKKYCKQHILINMKSHGPEDPLELSFYIHLKDQSKSGDFVREFGQEDGIQNVNLFFDEEVA